MAVSKAPLWATGYSTQFSLWKTGDWKPIVAALTIFSSGRHPLVTWWQPVVPFVISGSCHCGKCICSAEEWYISGEFCDCDDRDCDKHDGLICTGAVLTYANCSMSHLAIKRNDTCCVLLQMPGQESCHGIKGQFLIWSQDRGRVGIGEYALARSPSTEFKRMDLLSSTGKSTQ